jgi:ABC-type branched-subunit amino acid transport system ATPase component
MLGASYGRVPVLRGIDLTLRSGEFLGVLGHNGMGKTTLMRSLMGFIPLTSGKVSLNERDITKLKPHDRTRLGMGYVPQGRQIFPSLSVMDNMRAGCLAMGKENQGVIERNLELFPRLRKLLDRPGGALSGGEQQLLALARCLCTQPKLILLDEPTEGILRISAHRGRHFRLIVDGISA